MVKNQVLILHWFLLFTHWQQKTAK